MALQIGSKHPHLSLAKMLSGANASRISGYKLKPEDSVQQCYMPCGRRNNNSPVTGELGDQIVCY